MTYVSCYDQVLILITQSKYLLYKLVANFSYSIVVQIFPRFRFDSHLIKLLREGRLDNTQNQPLLLSRLLITRCHPRISLVALVLSFTNYTWSFVQCQGVASFVYFTLYTRLAHLVSSRFAHVWISIRIYRIGNLPLIRSVLESSLAPIQRLGRMSLLAQIVAFLTLFVKSFLKFILEGRYFNCYLKLKSSFCFISNSQDLVSHACKKKVRILKTFLKLL